ncbi:MAG TPA: GNAT family N-acetyltransferase [Thermoplasmata archaeon]
MRPPTQAIPPLDRDGVRAYLEMDAVANAVIWNRVIDDAGSWDVFVDRLPPSAVLGLEKPEREGEPTGVVLHAANPIAATDVAQALPSGFIFFHLAEEWTLPLLEARADRIHARPAWLFALDAKDFVDLQRHETQPLSEDAALMVARLWEPEWPAEGYVRRRIRDGPSFAIYADGRPVAWALTHFETDRVSMMGFLHVLEEYRGKGYAKSVSSALVKDILARGKTPALHVYVDNGPSLQLTAALGFHRVTRQIWGEARLR